MSGIYINYKDWELWCEYEYHAADYDNGVLYLPEYVIVERIEHNGVDVSDTFPDDEWEEIENLVLKAHKEKEECKKHPKKLKL